MTTQTLPRPNEGAAIAPFIAGATLVEGAHLAEMTALRFSELWLQALEAGLQTEHDLLMAMLGFRPEQHKAPWDTLDADDALLKAFDLALAAAGE